MLLEFKEEGIFVPQAGVYIDPWKPVKHAILTHGHADHARPGSKKYIASEKAVPVIKYRLGRHHKISGVPFGESFTVNGVNFSFHPAGHVIGSAQVRVEYKGEIAVVSGDYKVEDDGISEAFEPVKCHSFLTENTFGLPVFRWQPQSEIITEIDDWWRANAAEGRPSLLSAYSLGKAQRIIANVDQSIGPIFTHGAVENINKVLRKQGIQLPETKHIHPAKGKGDYSNALIIAPGSAINSSWSRRFKNSVTAAASGWMALRGNRRRRGVDKGFVLSDHADWDGLLSAIKATGAENIFVTHGYSDTFAKYLNTIGYNAHVVSTDYVDEEMMQD